MTGREATDCDGPREGGGSPVAFPTTRAAPDAPSSATERLGHSSIQVTLDRCGHLLPGLDEALTDGLERTYRQALAGFSQHRGRVASVASIPGGTGNRL